MVKQNCFWKESTESVKQTINIEVLIKEKKNRSSLLIFSPYISWWSIVIDASEGLFIM